MSVPHKILSVNIIDALSSSADHGFMNEAASHRVLVTYLSAYGIEHAPAEVALRAVELDLAAETAAAWKEK